MRRTLSWLLALSALASSSIAAQHDERLRIVGTASDVDITQPPSYQTCPDIDAFWQNPVTIDERRPTRILVEFSIDPRGWVVPDSTRIIRSTYASLKQGAIAYIGSCVFRPARTAEGRPVRVRVRWELRLSYR